MTADELLRQMTLEEKAALLTGADVWHIKNSPRLGVPPIMMSDGPHGLRKQVEKGDNMGVNDSIPAVCFPSAAGLASSFNRNLLKQLGETLGDECRAEHVDILLGPAINMKRSPLCGRNFEYFSEDPFLAGELAAGYVNGLQSKGVGASVKHFAANNQEYRRMTISAVAEERALREIYLSAFETVVKQAQPWTIMCSYNAINGELSSQNDWLLNQILRREWGFEGYVVTDWGAACDRVKGVAAGCDLEMPGSGERNTKRILEAVKNGKLKEADIDRAARRILGVSLRALQQPPSQAVFDRKKDHETARAAALESMVLLKNENGLLPLKKEQNIAFIGAFAQQPRYQGGGSSHVNSSKVIGALESAQKIAKVTYAKGYDPKENGADPALLEEAVRVATAVDVAVVFAGLTEKAESEGYDREHLNLSPAHNTLIEAVAKAQPNTVVVLHNGSPVAMPWISSVGAVLEAYLGGEACGEAVAALLFGEANPSGKLAETFPLSLEDVPCKENFPGNQLTVEYRESVYTGYRYYDTVKKPVLFPFGHGLSYTQFTYSDLTLEAKSLRPEDSLRISFTVKNTGAMDGAEVSQVYVAPPHGKAFRPAKELKGFEKTFLKAGEEKHVTFTLPPRAFQYYHTGAKRWYAEGGTYEIKVGASSRDIRLNAPIELMQEEELPSPYAGKRLPSYETGEVQHVGEKEFEELLGHPLPPSRQNPGERFTLESCLDDAKDTVWGKRIAALIAKIAGEKYGDYIGAAMCSPIRGIITPASDAHALAIVSLLNNEHTVRSLFTLFKWILSLKKKKN